MPAGIGPFSLRCENGELIITDERGGLSLTAQRSLVNLADRTILHSDEPQRRPGRVRGADRTQRLGQDDAVEVSRRRRPTRPPAKSLVGSDPLELRRTEVGYVPQSDVVHDRLRSARRSSTRPGCACPPTRRQRSTSRLSTTCLRSCDWPSISDTLIGSLSGGQRKRVACGVELIGKPTMLLLDEPTSGLDPPLERRLMLTFRHLADSGRGIVVVTHATSSLALCDTVAVMGEQGHLLFTGSPRESLEHFDVARLRRDLRRDRARGDPHPDRRCFVAPRPRTRGRLLSGRSLFKHTLALTSRYARTFGRDRRTLATLLGQAPIMALLIACSTPRTSSPSPIASRRAAPSSCSCLSPPPSGSA